MNQVKSKIKTSKISLKFANTFKNKQLASFIDDYRKAVLFYINYIWNNEITFEIQEQKKIFSIKKDLLNLPRFISTKNISIDSDLSARTLKCAITQAIGIIKSYIQDRKKLLYILSKKEENNERTRYISKKLRKVKLVCPNDKNIFPELNSICCHYEKSHDSSFDGFVILHSLGKKYGKIVVPINHTKHSRKLEIKGKLLTSFLLRKNSVDFRYSLEIPEIKSIGNIVGVDQGITTCLTLSNGISTQKCNHGHDLNSIIKKIVRKTKGSKAFHKALDHQKNYINWSLKQLDLSSIKELRLEKISNFRHGKNVGKFLNHFGETLIREKIKDIAQDAGVQIIEQSSYYRSQRCSRCGFVCKKSRIGKLFSCKHCLFRADADYNASCNHEQNLPDTKIFLHYLKKLKEFFWNIEGFFNLDGLEITVPNTNKRNNIHFKS